MVFMVSTFVKGVHLFHFLDHLRVIVIIPLSKIDPLLHLFESFLEHLSKLSGHILDLLLELIDLHFLNFESLFLFLSGLTYYLIVLLYINLQQYSVHHHAKQVSSTVITVSHCITSASVCIDESSQS